MSFQDEMDVDSSSSSLNFMEVLPREICLKILEYLIVPPQIQDLKARLKRAEGETRKRLGLSESLEIPGDSDDEEPILQLKRGRESGNLRRSKRLQARQQREREEDSEDEWGEEMTAEHEVMIPGNDPSPDLISIEPSLALLAKYFPSLERVEDVKTVHTSYVHGPLSPPMRKSIEPEYRGPIPRYHPGVTPYVEHHQPKPIWSGHAFASSRDKDLKIVKNLIKFGMVSKLARELSNDDLLWKKACQWLWKGKSSLFTNGPNVPHPYCNFDPMVCDLTKSMTLDELKEFVKGRVLAGLLDGWEWISAPLFHEMPMDFDYQSYHAWQQEMESHRRRLGLEDYSTMEEVGKEIAQNLYTWIRLIQVSNPSWLCPFEEENLSFESIFRYSFATAMKDTRRHFITGHELTGTDFGLSFWDHSQWGMGHRERVVCRFGRDGRYRSPWMRDEFEEAIPLHTSRAPSHIGQPGMPWILLGDAESNMYWTESEKPSNDPLPRLQPVMNAPEVQGQQIQMIGDLEIVIPDPGQKMGLHAYASRGVIPRSVVRCIKSNQYAKYRRNFIKIGPYPELSLKRGHDWSWMASNGVAILKSLGPLGTTPVIWRGIWWADDDE